MRKKFTLFCCFLGALSASGGNMTAQTKQLSEKLIYSTTFQDWEDVKSSVDPTIVNKTTNFSKEPLTFSLTGVSVDNDGTNTKFSTEDATPGYMMMEKKQSSFANCEMAVELSPLKSVTSVEFVVAATGNSRGLKLWKKPANGTWSVIYDQAANPAGGMKAQVNVNEENVALKFTNLNESQNAYLLSLNLYGMVEITAEQVTLTTEAEPAAGGTISVKPASPEYDKGTEVTVSATRNFGYRFINWTDADNRIVSESESFNYTLDSNTTLKANFETIDVYSLEVELTNGALPYMVQVVPAPTVREGKWLYETGTEVALTPGGNPILTFNHWENNSTEANRRFRITADTKVTANYSAAEYIVGWDFGVSDPKQDRAADFATETTNTGMFQSLTADGSSKSWLAKGDDLYQEGRHAVINWTASSDKAYFQAAFSTVNYKNIRILSSMLSCYFGFAVQKLEWSADGIDFKPLASLTFENQKTWYNLNASLPEAAEGKSKIYLRWIPDYTAGTLGSASDKDGTSITDIFILADKEIVNDETAPILLSSLPENQGTGVSANGSIILNFNERIQAGEGVCSLNGETLSAIYNNTTVIFNYNGLNYNSDYRFTVPAGALKDMSGNAFAGYEINFRTMEKMQPEARLYDIIVAADGSGDYTKVAEAISAAPENSIKPYLIFIKEGTYKEHIEIPASKPFIHLIGQDPLKVIITDDQLCGGDPAVTGKPSLHVSQGATVVVNAANFYAENISFENSWGIDKNNGPQALALFSNNDRITLNNCRLRSYQDTYLTTTRNVSDRHYLRNCLIEGAVDFIYGGGDVYFDACTLNIVRKSGGYIVAPSHKADTKWGYVFANNTITAPAPASETSVWLGRPWKDAPKTVFLNTRSEITIPAAGWYESMGAIPAIFADYNTVDAKGNKLDLSNRIEDYWYWKDDSKTEKVTGKAKNSLTDEEAATYTVKNVLSGNDNWQPTLYTEATDAPVVRSESERIVWDAVPYAISYVITRNGKVVAFCKETVYTPADEKSAVYSVQAVNEAGGLSQPSNEINYVPTSVSATEKSELIISVSNRSIHIDNVNYKTQINIFRTDGSPICETVISEAAVLPATPGIYIVKTRGATHQATAKVVVY